LLADQGGGRASLRAPLLESEEHGDAHEPQPRELRSPGPRESLRALFQTFLLGMTTKSKSSECEDRPGIISIPMSTRSCERPINCSGEEGRSDEGFGYQAQGPLDFPDLSPRLRQM
jgi:hypothetical protein